ncbi:MAG: C45 family peptidase [Planctomycetaceae bacterium]
MIRGKFRSIAFVVFWICTAPQAFCQENGTKQLTDGLRPLLKLLSGSENRFGVAASLQLRIDGKNAPVELKLVRYDDVSFDFDATHPDYSVKIRRRADATAMALPHHRVVFIGKGTTDENDHLKPKGILARLVSTASIAAIYSPLVASSDAEAVAPLLVQLLKVKYDANAKQWSVGNNAKFSFGDAPQIVSVSVDGHSVQLSRLAIGAPAAVGDWNGYRTVSIERTELERQLVRGVRRATEVLAPGPSLIAPEQVGRKVENGELRWVDGHRVVLLQGTPDEIGTAHGQLLHDESIRCFDSVLYSFGTVQTIVNGRWFRHDLEQAYARLAPHIPEHHKQETRAMARALNRDPKLAEVLNVFPEMFHCSGFAVFGSATQGGKLYHGRVLDYMTTIGLQDAATTFIMAPKGKIPFANVGYGGFIGSVSGMNTKAISLGEMGGRGEGKWDGVPMATLMRRALEECTTLDEVMDLWKNNPRTCEYYYVFADGKTNRAVGVAAYPESVEFLQPGQSHPLLGDGIKDAVVLSAGSRLEELRKRVTKLHGQIDASAAQGLMCRPVAMNSNLHNVLFVPEDGVLYVANADHTQPAADRPYVKLNLKELLQSMGTTVAVEK